MLAGGVGAPPPTGWKPPPEKKDEAKKGSPEDERRLKELEAVVKEHSPLLSRREAQMQEELARAARLVLKHHLPTLYTG